MRRFVRHRGYITVPEVNNTASSDGRAVCKLLNVWSRFVFPDLVLLGWIALLGCASVCELKKHPQDQVGKGISYNH